MWTLVILDKCIVSEVRKCHRWLELSESLFLQFLRASWYSGRFQGFSVSLVHITFFSKPFHWAIFSNMVFTSEFHIWKHTFSSRHSEILPVEKGETTIKLLGELELEINLWSPYYHRLCFLSHSEVVSLILWPTSFFTCFTYFLGSIFKLTKVSDAKCFKTKFALLASVFPADKQSDDCLWLLDILWLCSATVSV